MSTPRKKPSRKDQQQNNQYSYILSDNLSLTRSKNIAAQENDLPHSLPARGRRSNDFYIIGQRDNWEKLSSREKEVTYLVCQRKKNSEIATEMGITVGTVNSYLNHIYNKLDIRGKMDLFHMFYNFDFRNNPPY